MVPPEKVLFSISAFIATGLLLIGASIGSGVTPLNPDETPNLQTSFADAIPALIGACLMLVNMSIIQLGVTIREGMEKIMQHSEKPPS